MDAVFRNAMLVVAAAGAEDSTQGLFITDRPHTQVWNMPYGPSGIKGVFNMSMLPADHLNGTMEVPLRNRGWVLQEWYLARRILFCMPLTLAWECGEMYLAEGGSSFDMGNYESLSWLHLLESYTKKSLTYPSDRLHALRGISNHLKQSRQDEYLHDYGVWKDELHEQILWWQTEAYAETDSLAIPTWTWAATGGAKSWIETHLSYYNMQTGALTRRLEVSASGSLGSSGYLARPSLPLDALKGDMKLPLRHQIMYIEEPEFSGMLDLLDNEGDDDGSKFFLAEMPAFMVRDQSMSGAALGIVAFDSKPFLSASYFFVARSERVEREYSRWPNAELEVHGDTEGGRNGNEDNSISDPNGIHSESGEICVPSSKLNSTSESLLSPQSSPTLATDDQNSETENSEVCDPTNDRYEHFGAPANATVDGMIDLIETTPFVYWCLILEPAGEGKYKRVGLAMLYPHAFESMKPEMTDFEII
ncbi:hypothetical protein HBI52_106870 [Parastagonospora nodorum]|nr:hypothetical protein HBI95_086310 [Parastagonospora nodorum]KAH5124655.1 hypothetical protein HBH71_019740 [Parastagonospora nodorum]KAH5191349.1 hypothetical protein HBH68_151660 [Parastagonospora nodorum]KAH5515023.1 hypothetical protein HBI52_106870 [Parastagonospora nodorum]KAH5775120.1 hypothetical protein HBI16_100590 [Parastagonospora nodorum]